MAAETKNSLNMHTFSLGILEQVNVWKRTISRRVRNSWLQGTKWVRNERRHSGKQLEQTFPLHSGILWNVKINDRAKKTGKDFFQRPTCFELLWGDEVVPWNDLFPWIKHSEKMKQWEINYFPKFVKGSWERVTAQVSYMSRWVRKWKHLSLASWKIATIIMRFDLDSHTNTHHLVRL